MVYGGPRFLGRELIRDTALLHVEELAEILHAADGGAMLTALFLLELTKHPAVHGVAYDDALDAWTTWGRHRRPARGPRGGGLRCRGPTLLADPAVDGNPHHRVGCVPRPPRIPYSTADHLTTVLIHPADPEPGWSSAPAATP